MLKLWKLTKNCKECQKPFTIFRTHQNNKKFCSAACKIANRKRYERDYSRKRCEDKEFVRARLAAQRAKRKAEIAKKDRAFEKLFGKL